MHLGFIGFGKMAEALWVAYSTQAEIPFGFYEPNPERATLLQKHYGATQHDRIEDLVGASDTVLLCIKPQTLPQILPTLKHCVWDTKMMV